MVLHIDLGNQSLTSWMKENKYFIHSELVRYAEKLIENNLNEVQALMLSNLSDNVVFILKKENIYILNFQKKAVKWLSVWAILKA
jgi:phage antirepressor YoqD-like protein